MPSFSNRIHSEIRQTQHIENGMASGIEALSIATATGLIESLVSASDKNEAVWREIEAFLLAESKQNGFYVDGTRQIVVPKPWSITGTEIIEIKPLK